MTDIEWQEEVAQRVRVLRIIVGALVAGCAAFLAVAIVIGPRAPAPASQGVLTWVLVAFVVAILMARLVVPRIIVASARRAILAGTFQLPGGPARGSGTSSSPAAAPSDATSLLAVYQTRTIIGAALLEGCAFFATITYLNEGSPLSLVLAILLIVGVATHFPTLPRVMQWIETQLELLQQERQFG